MNNQNQLPGPKALPAIEVIPSDQIELDPELREILDEVEDQFLEEEPTRKVDMKTCLGSLIALLFLWIAIAYFDGPAEATIGTLFALVVGLVLSWKFG